MRAETHMIPARHQGMDEPRARFTASSAEWESKENIDAGLSDNWFYLATGGPIKKTRDLRAIIELPTPPQARPTWRP
ncbi:MAG TPA: hypothetical protein VM680_19540 [Verrucomicrobiae bacterium]|nr:hypothetical protein [Verrucomicrobiae bacterium]